MRGRHLNEKSVRLASILLGSLVLASVSFYGAYKLTIPSKICGICHMMKPEYLTWKASSHEKINCISCHIPPGPVNFVKSNMNGFKHIYSTATGNYVTPILKLGAISDEACERCHNMANRIVTTSEDLVIPHGKHKAQNVNCYKCHNGIVHGNIAKRQVTYEGDYQRWNQTLAETLMDDPKYIRPDMDLCMRCHLLRKVTVECDVCHKNGMKPPDHMDQGFKNGKHGKLAAAELSYCDSCHSYMSEKKVETLEEPSKYMKYLGAEPKSQVGANARVYARENTWCKDCHSKRPPSHEGNGRFIEKHGKLAQKDKEGCYVCHNNQSPAGVKLKDDPAVVANISCNDCHPSIHKSKRFYHPFELPPNGKINKSCYTCHSVESCGRCHGKLT